MGYEPSNIHQHRMVFRLWQDALGRWKLERSDTGVNKNAVSKYEIGKEIVASALLKLEKFFRSEGIVFVNEDASGGEGVRLPTDAKSRPFPPRSNRSARRGGKI